mmetsp:Transcript_73286/g.238417  ORF Transcript_73286/g.238417 Transcript_73286/m.238417 type:complete len:253 (+) Transcript_73286:1884-2642(+)
MRIASRTQVLALALGLQWLRPWSELPLQIAPRSPSVAPGMVRVETPAKHPGAASTFAVFYLSSKRSKTLMNLTMSCWRSRMMRVPCVCVCCVSSSFGAAQTASADLVLPDGPAQRLAEQSPAPQGLACRMVKLRWSLAPRDLAELLAMSQVASTHPEVWPRPTGPQAAARAAHSEPAPTLPRRGRPALTGCCRWLPPEAPRHPSSCPSCAFSRGAFGASPCRRPPPSAGAPPACRRRRPRRPLQPSSPGRRS